MADREEERRRLQRERQLLEAQQRTAESRRRRIQLASLAAFAAIGVIVALIVISQSGGDDDGGGGGTPSDVTGAAEAGAQLEGIPQEGTVLGEANAAVRVTEFADLQCPACASFATQVLPELIANRVRPGETSYEYRPWDIIGPDSPLASKAALAAGEQNRFFQFIQLFYLNQGAENSGYVTDEFLEAIADAAGVPDIERWNRDREDPRWDPVLKKNDADATSIGFGGTPSFLVTGPNGQFPLKGNGLGEIEGAIDQAG